MSGWAPPGGKLRYRLARLFRRHGLSDKNTAQALAVDPGVKKEIDRQIRENAPLTLAESDGVRRLLYLIGRGQTTAGKINSARLRSIWADPVRREEFLKLRAEADEKQRQRPRKRGKWLPDPPPTKAERTARQLREKENRSRASAARFADPVFRAKALAQLAVAREKEMERRRTLAASRRES